MVGFTKLSAVVAVSAMAATGAVASIQQHDASHASHLLAHRGLAERQSQNQPSLVKVQKRLGPVIGDGLGGIIGGLGDDLGLGGNDSSEDNQGTYSSFPSRAATSRRSCSLVSSREHVLLKSGNLRVLLLVVASHPNIAISVPSLYTPLQSLVAFSSHIPVSAFLPFHLHFPFSPGRTPLFNTNTLQRQRIRPQHRR